MLLQTPYAGAHGFQFSFIWFIIFFECALLFFTLAVTLVPSKSPSASQSIGLIFAVFVAVSALHPTTQKYKLKFCLVAINLPTGLLHFLRCSLHYITGFFSCLCRDCFSASHCPPKYMAQSSLTAKSLAFLTQCNLQALRTSQASCILTRPYELIRGL